MDNNHIFTILKEEVKINSRHPCYPNSYKEGLELVRQAGASFRSAVESKRSPNHAGRIRAEAIKLIVATIRFMRHLT